MRYYSEENSNVHRGVHYLSQKATTAYEGAREKVKRFINARDVRECIFVRGATEGINLVMHSYGRKFIGAGDEIIISAMEHHANIVPWQLVCEQTGATLKVRRWATRSARSPSLRWTCSGTARLTRPPVSGSTTRQSTTA